MSRTVRIQCTVHVQLLLVYDVENRISRGLRFLFRSSEVISRFPRLIVGGPRCCSRWSFNIHFSILDKVQSSSIGGGQTMPCPQVLQLRSCTTEQWPCNVPTSTWPAGSQGQTRKEGRLSNAHVVGMVVGEQRTRQTRVPLRAHGNYAAEGGQG